MTLNQQQQAVQQFYPSLALSMFLHYSHIISDSFISRRLLVRDSNEKVCNNFIV
jgi:hypothetical protein